MAAFDANVGAWFYEENGARRGPVTHEYIVSLIKAAKVGNGSLVWRMGFPEWLKVEDTELRVHLQATSPIPITGKHVNNTVVWILAFAPLIGMLIESAVAYAVNADDYAAEAAIAGNKYWFITLVLNIALSYVDENRLEKAGYGTKAIKGMTWLVPVYLFKRAKALHQGLSYFIVWVVCFVVAMVL